MGLLMSDITVIDPTMSDVLRLLDDLSEPPHEYDAARGVRGGPRRPSRVTNHTSFEAAGSRG